MCRVAPGPGGADRADGVKDKARRLFALFDFSKARALNSSELGIMLLSLGRALESFMGLKRGSSIAAFIDMTALDHAARVAVKRYDSALRRGVAARGVASRRAGGDVDLGAADSFAFTARAKGASSDDASQPRLPRKDFVEWSLRILSPYCQEDRRGSKGRDHKAGELIVKETEKGDDFFVVLDGSVECTKYVAGANDSVCPTLKKGDFFGELALLKNKNRAAAIALNASRSWPSPGPSSTRS
ncbi:cAMP-dependent protein kinase regulator [Aureococcus anophagefferens]|nr:cAMP-dependent protein kinase regulator [Aureococcus anophagefferens]